MLTLTAKRTHLSGTVPLPSSKSESNRSLIIQALNPEIILHNLASARDTQTMMRLLNSKDHVLDVIDAGTTMRFLTAYCAAMGKDQVLTGTPRMCQRPIGGLVEALRSLGAEIKFWNQEGYPPLHTIARKGKLTGGQISMPGNISSQFISAVLLVSPYFDAPLELSLEGGVTSKPYLDMTMALMRHFGAAVDWNSDSSILSQNTPYHSAEYTIESDWSGASYWYSLVALSEESELLLTGLKANSLQGDSQIATIMEAFGVKTVFTDEGARLTRIHQELPSSITIDCLETPDLAQTLAVVAAALGVDLTMTSLHTLRVKETDRIHALEEELAKFGVSTESTEDTLRVFGSFEAKKSMIHTYEDHRMAMAFAPLALKLPFLQIDEPDVVVKSYPEFWDHMNLMGISSQK